ncbi:nuclear transport factor 2 family protein [Flagellimonas allohymeniacidonis]|uniref:Nuclear transport factor 2 family protein n=1 Tax=Flagellimonas allohymeniacidonis TaxID=2517819 RepID=A0A4Q8QF98_9FLAO|nr:nuclear transport factor 2 family protein [Allomuricauda hymeniacidonis]TAI46989.1 nuclear transport factor 2 family protein [Allomuricauda hymeniacidonis]
MYQNEIAAIEQLIANYFNGIFKGDVTLLGSCFQEDVTIYGDIEGNEYKKSVSSYLDGVKNRKSPRELNEEFAMNIIGVDVMGKIAMAKLHVPMLGYNYYDYLSLWKIDDTWKIVNKVFTHVT